MANGWFNALGLVAMGGFLLGATAHSTPQRLGPGDARSDSELAVLEAAASGAGSRSGEELTTLVGAYLSRGVPGAAVAALERDPSTLTTSVTLGDLAARTYLEAGHATAALGIAHSTLARCRSMPCDTSTLRLLRRRTVLLEALVADGIEDPAASPEATERVVRRAFHRTRIASNDTF